MPHRLGEADILKSEGNGIMKRRIIGLTSALAGASALAAGAMAEDHGLHEGHALPASTSPYPTLPSPNYGPKAGSITFKDTDPGPTIGGELTMAPAVDAQGKPVDAASAGITMYMIHWGLEVGQPGTADDARAGDLGGDCKGFRDTGHVVMLPAAEAGKQMRWTIPQGTKVPDGAVYFVGHTIYGKIHNLNKCTQIPIQNWVKG